jgi:Ca2+-binding EF-hand superfamily protein
MQRFPPSRVTVHQSVVHSIPFTLSVAPRSPFLLSLNGMQIREVNIVPEITDGGRINISDMSPDINQDGVVEPHEQQIFDRLKAADKDGDGYISRKEMFDALKEVTVELKNAKAGGIPISTLNPDTDGDGKVEKWEQEVFERIKEADADKSGSIDVKELFGVIKGAAESDRQKRLFRQLFAGAVALLLVMLFANMGLTFAVVFLAKDTKASGAGELTTLSGGAIKTNGVAAYGLIWDLPAVETATLASLKTVTLDADLKAGATGTNWPSKMQATFEVRTIAVCGRCLRSCPFCPMRAAQTLTDYVCVVLLPVRHFRACCCVSYSWNR